MPVENTTNAPGATETPSTAVATTQTTPPAAQQVTATPAPVINTPTPVVADLYQKYGTHAVDLAVNVLAPHIAAASQPGADMQKLYTQIAGSMRELAKTDPAIASIFAYGVLNEFGQDPNFVQYYRSTHKDVWSQPTTNTPPPGITTPANSEPVEDPDLAAAIAPLKDQLAKEAASRQQLEAQLKQMSDQWNQQTIEQQKRDRVEAGTGVREGITEQITGIVKERFSAATQEDINYISKMTNFDIRDQLQGHLDTLVENMLSGNATLVNQGATYITAKVREFTENNLKYVMAGKVSAGAAQAAALKNNVGAGGAVISPSSASPTTVRPPDGLAESILRRVLESAPK